MSKNTSVVKYAAIASAVAAACGASYTWAAGTLSAATPVTSGRAANIAAATTADMVGASGAATLFSVTTADTTYSVNDVITLTFAGGSLRTTNAITPAVPTCAVSATGNSTIVVGFLNKTSSTVTYRLLGTGTASITNGTIDKSSQGITCDFPAAQYSITRNSATTLGASSVTVNYRANQGGETGVTFDQTLSAGIIGVVNQFTSSAVANGAFSGTVDVNAARLAWTNASSATSRTLAISVAQNSPSSYASAYFGSDAQTSLSYDIFGAGNGTENAFAFLNDDGGDCTAADLTAGAGTASVDAGTLSISANCATLTVTNTGFIGSSTPNKSFTVTLSKSSATTGLVIADGSFTVSPTFTVTIATAASQAITSFSGGSFGINGLVATIPYMPYGVSGTSAITQAYYITNRSTSAGAVTGVAYNEAGTSCNLGTVGTASARAVTNLSANINDKINACYTGNQRVYVTLTSATPAASTEVFASYNVGGNQRVNVANDSLKTISR